MKAISGRATRSLNIGSLLEACRVRGVGVRGVGVSGRVCKLNCLGHLK